MDGPTRVLLIKPYTNVRPAIVDVPIGPLYLLSYLRHHLAGAVDTKFIDLRLSRHRRTELVSMLTGFSPQVVGISLLTFNRAFLDTYLPVIRAHAPGALIVVGGPYATYHYADILDRHREVDVAVIGEGEQVFLNLVRTVIEEGDVQAVKGIACRRADAVACNEREPYIEDLDAIPFPDYEAIDIRRYWGNHPEMNGVLAKKAYTHIISSRACPYHCVYCHNIFGKKVRKRSPENFVAEIELLYHQYGVREFQIIDDIFNIDRPRMHDILRRIMSSGMKIKIAFPNGLRGDLLTHEDIDLLQAAGAYMITLAIETASTRMQKIVRKHLDIPRVMDNIAYAADRGLIVKGYFMIGFPGETVEEMKQTIDLAVKSKLDLAHFFTVIPFEGTELAEMARALYPDVGREVATHYLPARPFYQEATGYNLNRLQKTAYLRFYGSLRTVRTFFKMPRKLHRLQRWAAFALDVFRA